MNKAILMGNLGADPELRYAGDKPVLNMRLATSVKWKDKNTGEKKQRTEWHSLVLWGNRAEALSPHLHKGDKILVEGEIQYRKYTAKDGTEKWATDINVSELEFTGSQASSGGDDRPPPAASPPDGPEGWGDDDGDPPFNR